MLNKSIAEYTYDVTEDGSKACALEVRGSKGGALTVSELRDYLNELIADGYGDYSVEADTQDGSTYPVRDEVIVYEQHKNVTIF